MRNYVDLYINVDLPENQRQHAESVKAELVKAYPGASISVYVVQRWYDFRGEREIGYTRGALNRAGRPRRRLSYHLQKIGRIINSTVYA